MISSLDCARCRVATAAGTAAGRLPAQLPRCGGSSHPRRIGVKATSPAARPHAATGPVMQRRTVLCAAGGDTSTKDKVDDAHQRQKVTTQLMAELIEAENLREVAHRHAEEFEEDFFNMALAYLQMAQKEQNQEMVHRLKVVIKVAKEEKQSTLRPEIRLLNDLLSCKNREQRRKIFKKPETRETLQMNDSYFFETLLKRMIADVHKQADTNDQRRALETELKHIEQEAEMMLETYK